jgi:four helix bundle protein
LGDWATRLLVTKNVYCNCISEDNKNFYDLETWQTAHKYALNIYKITEKFPDSERFGIISQLRRAASSITANISEGYDRYYFKDKIRFYYNARGSSAETQNFLFLSRDLGYITIEQCNELFEKSNEVRKLLNGLIRYTETRVTK